MFQSVPYFNSFDSLLLCFLLRTLLWIYHLVLSWTYSICMYFLHCLNMLNLSFGSPELNNCQFLPLNLIHGPYPELELWNDEILNSKAGEESKRLPHSSNMQNNLYFSFNLALSFSLSCGHTTL